MGTGLQQRGLADERLLIAQGGDGAVEVLGGDRVVDVQERFGTMHEVLVRADAFGQDVGDGAGQSGQQTSAGLLGLRYTRLLRHARDLGHFGSSGRSGHAGLWHIGCFVDGLRAIGRRRGGIPRFG